MRDQTHISGVGAIYARWLRHPNARDMPSLSSSSWLKQPMPVAAPVRLSEEGKDRCCCATGYAPSFCP